MDIYLYGFYVVAYAGLLFWGLSSESSRTLWTLSSVAYLVVIGLIYDNVIIFSGKWIGEGSTLESLSSFRFWSHAFLTPLLILFSWDVLRRAGVKWARKKAAAGIAVILTAISIVIELVLETKDLQIKPEMKYGVLRYVSAEPASGPPVMILIVTAALLIAGFILWRKTGWKWMFIGTVLMTIGSMVPNPIDSDAITNGFELILLFSLVATKRYQNRTNKENR